MTKVEIADDAGDEITEITTPIPFYIRVHLEDGTKRYRVRLIDDNGSVRGQYQGTTDRKYLELHVPLIKLPEPGQLRIIIEESTGHEGFEQEHQVSIHYLPYKEETEHINTKDDSDTTEEDFEIREEETETNQNEEKNISSIAQNDDVDGTITHKEESDTEDFSKIDEEQEKTELESETTELTREELEYLEERKRIFNNGLYEFDEEE
ncbi:MAG: hypothetical protein ACTSW1_00510 [Candidatus Hodarchaeales archaeon]